MFNDANTLVDIIKEISVNAVNNSQPTSLCFGVVASVEPLKIRINQKLTLEKEQLILTSLVQDFDVDMSVEHETEGVDLTHNHNITITSPHGDTGIIDSALGNHVHEYKGKKTFTVHLALEKDEKVILIKMQGGQRYLVLDRVRG